ncbi:aspartate/methionine/tyrosine aminotransferase [Scopulibacillus darangshiensis]|uniref:Aspartate/methionine/tyrosine aminotransferase n=1 Tax=Scopulibacillus darangshiensis TaxID=442528 RepID=A0A4R2P5Z7_9BACL|nr:aminotransferase class I/II-fold pyridoxal phosphate-dependent enzyme [Scopulibacillus darangshiensis]TCP29205.1 aspartate/methionine/tyrosine aminotransferase [Scopulibacillus darangshiensis]
MHALAKQLNDTIQDENPYVYSMLSDLGKQIYYPKEGILSQSAEAKQKANKFNATIGIALENNEPMHLQVIQDTLSSFAPKDIYNYAPPAGKPELRTAWRNKMLSENPSLKGKEFGNPIVTNALTHGLSITADLFVDEGDSIIIPDKNWENYKLTFGIRRKAEIISYPFYDKNEKFNAAGLRQAVLNQKHKGKAIVILNFPNNPTGYTPGIEEGKEILAALKDAAESGMNIVVITDDAYFGLFFEDSLQESLFGGLSQLHPRILPIKIDGATKEEYIWGFRVGFLTYASQSDKLLNALEQKTMGIIRATISSGPHPSQTFVLHALNSPEFHEQKQEKFVIMKRRANLVKEVLDDEKYNNVWEYYPFNSGYFMCLKLKTVDAESLRMHLLDYYGIGTIALGETDLRVAFSCIEEEDIEELFSLIYQSVKEVEQKTVNKVQM